MKLPLDKRYPLNITEVLPIPYREEVIIITMLDVSKDEGSFKVFENVQAADEFRHDASLRQCPEWHAHNCDVCEIRRKQESSHE